jgi:hypothetical protein
LIVACGWGWARENDVRLDVEVAEVILKQLFAVRMGLEAIGIIKEKPEL